MTRRRRPIFFYTIYNKAYSTFVLNFEILDAVVPEKSLAKIGVRDRKKRKLVKGGKNKSQNLGFPSHNKLGNFQDASKICALWLS